MSQTTAMSVLSGTDARSVRGVDVRIEGVAYRADEVSIGDMFVCVRGFAHDGHDFASEALSLGAVALVVERELPLDVPQFVVADSRRALAMASSAVHGHPSHDIRVVGVTGTNGKTTTTYLIDSVLREASVCAGVVGTVETRIADRQLPAVRTTPESADLQGLFARMRDAGVSVCSMEVSSHAIDLRRLDGTRFAVAAFTNLTQDHLDFHHTIEEYFAVKKRLFTDFDVGARVVNIDDPFGRGIASEIPGCITVGRATGAAVRAEDEVLTAEASEFTLVTVDGFRRVRMPIPGAYNVSNALVAAGCAMALGIGLDDIVAGLESAPQVPGRLERVDCGQPFAVVVDYAHTPDSLAKAIDAMKTVTSGRVIVVFGCGGDRDSDKRSVMGSAAGNAADFSIITSDNPRSEDPVGIILQIEDGMRPTGGHYEVVIDRHKAIERAILLANPRDTVLIAGKGHEDYQIFADRTVHFDDREVAREVLGRC
ncbi:MAG: UDP-N-acetylmuramoyl-L-alanyl-D-glutamate--2,6-diaminopimelate ligase [Coriobacteriia bacterium]|nr:UDP-N-acetylmuramoyl-L-alanyl-D-glutamate--2,6-diaminopimelate ligase [Coriobacteriia bacterium]